MGAGDITQALSCSRIFLIATLALALLLSAACSNAVEQLNCPAGLHLYKNNCLSSTSIEYVGCTEGRGFSTIDEGSIGLGGTFRVVANASLEIAATKSKQENTPVALQIVKDCLEIAMNSAALSQSERDAAVDFERVAEAALDEFEEVRNEIEETRLVETPALTLFPESARHGEQVTVTGAQFQANEMVDIRVHSALVKQVQADANGAFSTTIVVPPDAPPPGFSTSITATGQTSARSARAPFRTAP